MAHVPPGRLLAPSRKIRGFYKSSKLQAICLELSLYLSDSKGVPASPKLFWVLGWFRSPQIYEIRFLATLQARVSALF